MKTTERTLRATAALLALCLFVAACTTGDSDDDTAEPTTTTTTAAPEPDDEPEADEPQPEASEPEPDQADADEPEPEPEPVIEEPRTASFRGITEDTIQIGVGFWDTSVFGFGFFGDPDLVWSALTGAVNARGGVNGRNLEYSIAGFNPASNEQMLAACISLTEDAQVFAVLGGMRGDANYCVFEQHETIHLGSQVNAEGEAFERARAPIAGFFPAGNVRESSFIAELEAMGWFDGAQSIGVHYDGDSTAGRLSDAVATELSELGLDLALTLNIDDLVLDEDTLESQTDIMREQARAADLDRIIIFGAAATGLITYGELDVDLAAVDSNNFTTAINSGIDPADIDGTIATTSRISLESDPIDATTQQCLDDAQAAIGDVRFERPGPGVVNNADDPNYWSYTVLACRDLDLFVQAAGAAGVNPTNDSFRTGIESLTNISLPEIPFVSFAEGKYNGGDTLRLVMFDADADEDGELIPLGEPVDLTP